MARAGGVVAVTGEVPVLWVLARSSGLVAMGLLTLSVLLGIAAGMRNSPSWWPRFVTQGVHRWAAATGVLLLVAHVASVVLDPHAEIDLLDVVVPFGVAEGSVWVGLGTLAVDLLLLIVVTSLVRTRLRPAVWRGVHVTAYAAWGLAIVHGIGVGTDAQDRWVVATTAVSVGLVVASLVLRLTRGRGHRGTRYRAPERVRA